MSVPASGERPALPREPGTLAPLGPSFDEALEAGLGALGLDATQAAAPAARLSYEAHARLLRAWNAAINLTAIREPAEIARRHVCDALSAVEPLARRLSHRASLLDVGSGGGYPGLPLAAGLPLSRVGLLDSVAKKARFLEVAAAAVRAVLDAPGCHAPAIEIVAQRAEDAAREPDTRAAWDVVTARAVGSLAEVVELCMPLAREGGWVVAWKREREGESLDAELRQAGSIIRACGGGRPEVVAVEASFLAGHRLVLVPKVRPTPAAYPRPASTRRGRRRR